ncbi:MAG: hypothetical protein ACLUI3_06550 [Christensenellales bacterium]
MLIDLTAYHDEYLGKRHLKDELGARFPQSHSFLYRGDVFLFLYGKADFNGFSAWQRFELKVVLSDDLDDLFSLGALPHGARGAGADDGSPFAFTAGSVCTVSQLRTPLLLKNVEGATI